MQYELLRQFSATSYNCGAYGAGSYNETGCSTTANGSTSSGSTGSLANTGLDVFLFAAIGIVLVVTSAAYFIRNLRKRKK